MTSIQRRRVAITGMGTVNPCGNSVGETWEALLAGRTGIGLIDRFDTTDFTCKIAGQVKGLCGTPSGRERNDASPIAKFLKSASISP